jgi:hypothetical protein
MAFSMSNQTGLAGPSGSQTILLHTKDTKDCYRL